jgi:hypothetical protein
VTLPAASKRTAHIPEEAAYFAFAYPLPGFEDSLAEILEEAPPNASPQPPPQPPPADGSPPSLSLAGAAPAPGASAASWLAWSNSPLARFLSTGGFVYFYDRLELLSANGLCDGEGLHLEGPKELPSRQLRTTLYDAGRVQRVTLAPLLARGVTGFAWLAAAEKVSGEWGGRGEGGG